MFDTSASYPAFLITLKKNRESTRVYEDGSTIQRNSNLDTVHGSSFHFLKRLQITKDFFHSFISHCTHDADFASEVQKHLHTIAAGFETLDPYPCSWPEKFRLNGTDTASLLRIFSHSNYADGDVTRGDTLLDTQALLEALRISVVFLPIFSAEKIDGRIVPMGSFCDVIKLEQNDQMDFGLLQLILAREFYLLARDFKTRVLLPCSFILPLFRSECIWEAQNLLPKKPSARTNSRALEYFQSLQVPSSELSEELRTGSLSVYHVVSFFLSFQGVKLYEASSEEQMIANAAQSIAQTITTAMFFDEKKVISSKAPFFASKQLFVSHCSNILASDLIGKLQSLNPSSLRSLSLRDSGVDSSVLEFCFGRFRSLILLDVSENSALVNIHPSISALTDLKHLGLSKCRNLLSLPDELLELSDSVKVIDARDCPLLCFPPKFIIQQGCIKILQFLKDTRKSKPLKRVKVLFLGEPGSGKTSFLHAVTKTQLPMNQYCDPD